MPIENPLLPAIYHEKALLRHQSLISLDFCAKAKKESMLKGGENALCLYFFFATLLLNSVGLCYSDEERRCIVQIVCK